MSNFHLESHSVKQKQEHTSGVMSSGLIPVPPVVKIKFGRNSSLNFNSVS